MSSTPPRVVIPALQSLSSGGRIMLDKNNSEEQFRAVDAWLREYVGVADPRVGRSGPVCPFIPRALKERAVETRMRYDIDGASEAELIDELRAEINDFGTSAHSKSNSGVRLDSRVIVMPRMEPAGWERLDAAYEQLKHSAVESGKMIGKFHPRCDDRAVRNSGFRVSVAPVAMLAIRHMAPHDILFLRDSERWFREYDSRFGSHYQRNQIRDSLLRTLYSDARDRHYSST
jgi:heptaprenyl diphosphate synthase